MSESHILLGLGGIGAAALASQWLAWRLRLPAILFLLLCGILAGPLLGWLHPTHCLAHCCSRWCHWPSP